MHLKARIMVAGLIGQIIVLIRKHGRLIKAMGAVAKKNLENWLWVHPNL
jgi:hypothetical protein